MPHWQRLADVGTAVAVLVAAQLTTSPGHHLRDPIAVGLAALACAPLVGRRRRPYPALLVSTVAAEGYLAWVHDGGGTLILAAPLIALYTVVETGTRRRSLWVAAAVVLLIGVLHTAVKSGRWLGAENLRWPRSAGWRWRPARRPATGAPTRPKHCSEPRRRSPPSGCGSPATCTTASATTWP